MVTKADTMASFKWTDYGVYGDCMIIYPKPYSIYLRRSLDYSSWSLPAKQLNVLRQLQERNLNGPSICVV